MRITDASAQQPIRELHRVAPLRYAERLTLPVGQRVSTLDRSSDALVRGILSAVKGGDFAIVASTLGSDREPPAAPDGRFVEGIIAERKVRRVASGASMRASIAILVAAGIALGGLDMFVVGSVIYAVPWVAVAAVGAFLLWLRYGRTYQSEVMSVAVSFPPRSSAEAPSGASRGETVEVDWRVGRIRSVAFSGIRAAVDVEDCPVSLMETLVRAVRRFESGAS